MSDTKLLGTKKFPHALPFAQAAELAIKRGDSILSDVPALTKAEQEERRRQQAETAINEI